MKNRAAIAALSIGFLASCGGGGGDSEPTPAPQPTPVPEVTVPAPQPTPAPEVTSPMPKAGLYITKDLAGSYGFDFIVDRFHQFTLENGESWIIDHVDASGTPAFFAQGNFTLTMEAKDILASQPWPWANVFRGESYRVFKDSAALIATGSTVLQPSPLEFVEVPHHNSVTATNVFHPAAQPEARAERELTFSVEPGRFFDYNRAADLSEAQGDWIFYNPRRPVPWATLSVASNGTFAGGNAATGCSFSGTLTPRPSGKNVFDTAVTVTDCADAGAYAGIAYSFSSLPNSFGSPAVQVLKLMAVTTDKTRMFHLQMTPAPKG